VGDADERARTGKETLLVGIVVFDSRYLFAERRGWIDLIHHHDDVCERENDGATANG